MRAFLPVDEQLEIRRTRIEEGLWHLSQIIPIPSPTFHPIEEENWSDSWKARYRPIPIGERLLIQPSWLPPAESDRLIIFIDPGQAFGTGTHPSTRLCLAALEEHLLPGDAVFDLGCGSGIHMSLFCSQCKQITGIDYSEKMVETARKLMEGTRAENWELHVADAQALPLDDRKFDWIISMGLLDYVESPQRVLRECHRVLKDNGAIVFTIPKTPSLFSFLRSPIGNMIKRTVFSLPPVDNVTSRKGLEALLGASGFQLCEVSSVWTAMWIVKATKADHTEPEAS